MSSWDPFNRHIYYYNNNLIRSARSCLVDRDWSTNQTRRGALSLINWFVPVNEMIRHFGSSYCYNDKFIIYFIPFLCNEKTLIKFHGSNVQHLLTKERLSLFILCLLQTLNSKVLSWKSFKMHQKDEFMFTSRICSFHYETDKVFGWDFVWCDMNDVTIPHALCTEKNIVYYIIGFREGWYGFRKPQFCYPEHPITFCEISSIKTDKIDGYIIFWLIKENMKSHLFLTGNSKEWTFQNACLQEKW